MSEGGSILLLLTQGRKQHLFGHQIAYGGGGMCVGEIVVAHVWQHLKARLASPEIQGENHILVDHTRWEEELVAGKKVAAVESHTWRGELVEVLGQFL